MECCLGGLMQFRDIVRESAFTDYIYRKVLNFKIIERARYAEAAIPVNQTS
jgi:hypothetical protein